MWKIFKHLLFAGFISIGGIFACLGVKNNTPKRIPATTRQTPIYSVQMGPRKPVQPPQPQTIVVKTQRQDPGKRVNQPVITLPRIVTTSEEAPKSLGAGIILGASGGSSKGETPPPYSPWGESHCLMWIDGTNQGKLRRQIWLWYFSMWWGKWIFFEYEIISFIAILIIASS